MSRKQDYPRTGPVGWLNVLKWEGMRKKDRDNEKRVNLFAAGWALTLMAVAAIVAFGNPPAWIGWCLAIIPALFGLLCLKAYLKLLREADEMLRRIQFEAMAVGFGTGIIVGNTLVVIDSFPREWIAAAIVAPMAIAFTIRVILAARDIAKDEEQ
jgi:uncharacterized protein YacL